MQLAGISAVVTGAASGLGAATTAALVGRGVSVVGIDLAAGIDKLGDGSVPGARYEAADVTSEEDVTRALYALPDGAPLRLVVNCAGIAPAQRILSSKGLHDLGVFRRTIEVNLVGTFNVLRLGAARIAQTDPDENGQRGLIVNTASVAAYEGQIGQAAYSASKGGVVGLTITAARGPGALRHPRRYHRPRHRGHPHARLPRPRGGCLACRGHSLSQAAGAARRVRAAGDHARRARLPQRRDDPHGRGAPDGTAVSGQYPAAVILDGARTPMGIQAVILAAQFVRGGEPEFVVAGGQESMSQALHLLPGSRSGYRYGPVTLLDHMAADGLEDAYDDISMGLLTERRNDIEPVSRADQDEFAASSHCRAAAAWDAGRFAAEVAPVTISQRRATR